MEKEKILKFKAMADNDPELMEKLRAVKSVDEVIAIAAEYGVSIEKSDFAPMPEGELDPEQLAKVSGGDLGDEILESTSCVLFGLAAIW